MCVLDNTAQGLGQGKKQAHFEDSWQGHGASFDPFAGSGQAGSPRLRAGQAGQVGHGERSEKGGRAGREVGNNLQKRNL